MGLDFLRASPPAADGTCSVADPCFRTYRWWGASQPLHRSSSLEALHERAGVAGEGTGGVVIVTDAACAAAGETVNSVVIAMGDDLQQGIDAEDSVVKGGTVAVPIVVEIPVEGSSHMPTPMGCSVGDWGCTPRIWMGDVDLAAWKEVGSVAQELGCESSACWDEAETSGVT